MINRDNIRQVVEDSETVGQRVFDWTIQILIVFSLICFSLETLPGLSGWQRAALWWAELATVSIFTMEYLLRCYIAERPTKFVFSFFGIVDLLAILPFYLSLGVDLRSLRSLRMIRLFRILKLARYSSAMQRFHIAFRLAKEEIVLFFSLAFILFFLAAAGIYHFESEAQPDKFGSIFHSLWWAVATLTTVGYGDVFPITAGGKVYTFAILLIGLGIISVPPGLVASALSQAREIQNSENIIEAGQSCQRVPTDFT